MKQKNEEKKMKKKYKLVHAIKAFNYRFEIKTERKNRKRCYE